MTKKIAIARHINPDADSIGSLLALGLGIEKLGKRVYMISADGVPKKYNFLPGASRILNNIDKRVDLAISVDCSNKELLGQSQAVFKNGRLVWSAVKGKDFYSIKGKDEDVDAVADQMRSIKGVEIAILFREKNKELLRVSLRSKGRINAGAIAEYYKGGGHFDVAGCHIANNQKSIKELLTMAERL